MDRSHDGTWQAVQTELRGLVAALNGQASQAMTAMLHTRLAIVRLQRAAIVFDLDPQVVPAALSWRGEAAHLDGLSPAARVEAMAHLQDALAADPGCVAALRAAATLTAASGRWTEAAAHLETLAEVSSDDGPAVLALLKRADILHRKRGRPNEARDALMAARERVGDDPTVLDRLLKVELEREAWADALEICYTLIERLGGRADASSLAVTYRLTLGEIHLYGLNSPAGALRHYLEALQALPGYALAYTLVQELLEQNDAAALIESLAQLPTDDRAHLQPSIDALAEAAEAHPDDPEALITDLRIAVQARSAGLH